MVEVSASALIARASGHGTSSTSKAVSGAKTVDFWAVCRLGSVSEVDYALGCQGKNGLSGNIDARNALGTTALHLAVARNHCPIVARLLAAGADPDIRDGESGWSSLHRALHFGHLAVAGLLIAGGASLEVEDTRGRTPIDLIPTSLRFYWTRGKVAGDAEVYSWGNGANYQLGTGITGIQHGPCRVEALQGLKVRSLACARFHSAAVTECGNMLSWGFGRGGRLGHPDFDIHSGSVCVIEPREVVTGLGDRRVRAIATAKHHTVVATEGGEVFTWGSNRDGRLGYNSVDSQPTPRKVAALRACAVGVAAANKHSVAVTVNGEVFTWGCNDEGQLGYGTSNSASNCVPRAVEYLQGRRLCAVSAAKYHTVVLTGDGEVFTWGHKMVTPRKVPVSRDVRKAGNSVLKFHRSQRLHVAAVSAGVVHSTALSQDGLVFFWKSADPNIRCQQLTALNGHEAVAVSSGKYRTAVVTSTGDVFSWDSDSPLTGPNGEPVVTRVPSLRRVFAVSVGEKHSVASVLVDWPEYPVVDKAESATGERAVGQEDGNAEEGEEESTGEGEEGRDREREGVLKGDSGDGRGSTLKSMCEDVIATQIVDMRNVFQVLEVADSVGADRLKVFCQEIIVRNLDYSFVFTPSAVGATSSSVLAELEPILAARSASMSAGRWQLPCPTAPLPPLVDSDEEGEEITPHADDSLGRSMAAGRWGGVGASASSSALGSLGEVPRFLLQQPEGGGGPSTIVRQLRAVKKKLQQIETLEAKQRKGKALDVQQLAKLAGKRELETALSCLEAGILPPAPPAEPASKPAEKPTKASPKQQHPSSPTIVSSDAPLTKIGMPVTSSSEPNPPRANKKVPPVPSSPPVTAVVPNARASAPSQSPKTSWGQPQSSRGFAVADLESSPESSLPPLALAAGAAPVPVGGSSVQKVASGEGRPATSGKRRAKKGGLSMFLSGDLEVKLAAKSAPSAPAQPAWGGSRASAAVQVSLREIQSMEEVGEKASTSGGGHMGGRSGAGLGRLERGSGGLESGVEDRDGPEGAGGGAPRVSLAEFVKGSSPILMGRNGRGAGRGACRDGVEEGAAVWSKSPGSLTMSLRDIQLQEEMRNQQKRLGVGGGAFLATSPGLSTSPVPTLHVAAHELGTSASTPPNRWFRPDMDSPSSIVNIQKEEAALKELRKMYGNARIRL